MFPVNTASDLSYSQLWLLHWLQVYDWVFSLDFKERPNEDVINDDERFDAWHKAYIAKQMGDSRSGYSPQGKNASSHNNIIKF